MTMFKRRVRARSLVTVFAALLSLVVALLVGGNAASASSSATTEQAFITMYGWYDNTPPSATISYPVIHQTAGGTGTWADPITYASSTAETKAGTRIYVPRVQKYFIMEDDCSECDADWSGHGPDGGPNMWHFDLWLGGKGGNAISAIECEDALTNYNPDNTPKLESVLVNPPSNETVSSAPLFNTSNGNCYGGAKPLITVGQYKNKGTSQCLNDPGDKTTAGWTLGMAACSSAAGEQFIFDGTFLSVGKVANSVRRGLRGLRWRQHHVQGVQRRSDPAVVRQHQPDHLRHPDGQAVLPHQRQQGDRRQVLGWRVCRAVDVPHDPFRRSWRLTPHDPVAPHRSIRCGATVIVK